jgi:hypothetical protein
MSKQAVFLLACALFFGCGQTRVAQLTERTDVYNRSLKWGSLGTAGSLVAESNRRTLVEKIARSVGENPIVDYSVLDLSVEPGDRKGSALVEFSFYGASDQTLHYRQEMQIWQWDSAKHDWFLLEAREVRSRKN